MNMKDTLVNEFLAFKGMNSNAIGEFIQKIEAHTSYTDESAPELQYILFSLKAALEDTTSGNFTKCMKIAAPIFDWVSVKETLEFLDIVILGYVLQHAPSYKLANELAQKSIDTLKQEHTDKKYKSILFMIYMNMAYRLLRARFHEIKNTMKQKSELNEIETLFSRYTSLAIDMCQEYNRTIQKATIFTRRGLFYGDCEQIQFGLNKLKELDANDWYKNTKDEVAEYLCNFNDELTIQLHNMRTGVRMRKSRLAIGMSASQLADLLGVSHSQINSYESGERGMKRARLSKIAGILGCSVAYLNGEENVVQTTIQDPYIHKINQALRNATDDDKKFVFDFVMQYLKQAKKLRDDDYDEHM